MVLPFLIRQITVYASVIGFSLFIGHKANPQDYALFSLINAFFGMSYIICDFGFGKAAIRYGYAFNRNTLSIASKMNFSASLIFAIVVFSILSAYSKFFSAPLIISFFILSAGLSINNFYRLESNQRFDLIGRAEIVQVMLYIFTFFLLFFISNDVVLSIIISSTVRSLSIPLSYYYFSKKITVISEDLGELNIKGVIKLFLDGLQYQVSQLIFVSKDIILLYVLSFRLSTMDQGFVAMAQTYSLLPILFVGPVSRILLPKLSVRSDDASNFRLVLKYSVFLGLFSIIVSTMLYLCFPFFDAVVFDGKFSKSYSLVKLMVVANVFTLLSIPVVSLLSVLLGYRIYLGYAAFCVGLTWTMALIFPVRTIDDYALPILSGHAVNIVVVILFYIYSKHKASKENYAI